ncbi:MAG: hypothetical protein A2583_03020 [Bdellovibrionales bacterium RIFOXYD1_FULL_53_11]|nr:MAG: hypothetical protein A2583_03020 [Bdellovibrionales bacterium RIFOXYD1_FULL_53_11]
MKILINAVILTALIAASAYAVEAEDTKMPTCFCRMSQDDSRAEFGYELVQIDMNGSTVVIDFYPGKGDMPSYSPYARGYAREWCNLNLARRIKNNYCIKGSQEN